MSESGSRVVDTLPVVMFCLFAVFWTGYDIALGMWLATIPSLLVAVALVAKLARKGGA